MGSRSVICHPEEVTQPLPQPKLVLDLATKGRIAAAHGRFDCIRQVAPMCTRPSNTRFLGPTRFHTANGIAIGSALFGQPFAKRFALCYQTVLSVCLSCPVCL